MRYRDVTPSTVRAMPTQRISVTLDASAIEGARRAAGPRGLSAYLDGALQDRLDRDERRHVLLAYLDELEAADPTSPEVRHEADAWAGPAEWDRRRGGRPCCTSTSCRRVHHRPLGPPTAHRRSAPRGRGLTLTLTDYQVTAQPSLGLRRGEGRHCANCGTLVRWRILRLSAPLPHRSTTNRAQCSAPGQAGSNCSGIRRGR